MTYNLVQKEYEKTISLQKRKKGSIFSQKQEDVKWLKQKRLQRKKNKIKEADLMEESYFSSEWEDEDYEDGDFN